MKNLLFSLLLIVSLNAFGQLDYRQGYVVLKNGDTVRGSINFVNDLQNSKACVFKQNAGSATTTYYPGEISAYRFNDSKYFISKKIHVDDSTQLLFMEFLLKGKVNLYYCRTWTQDHYFIEKDTILQELDNAEVFYKEDGITNVYQPSKFRGQFKYLFMDCPSITDEISGLNYSKKSLIKISKEYHERTCTDEKCTVFEKSIPKIKIVYGISVNYAITDFNYALEFYMFDLTKMHSKGVDGFVEINIPAWSEQMFLRTGISYLNFRDERETSTAAVDSRFKTDISSLGLSVELMYKLRVNKVSPYLSLGTCLHKIVQKTVLYSTDFAVKDYSGYKSDFSGVYGGAGFEYKIFRKASCFLACNYEYLNVESKGFRFKIGIIF